MRMRRLLLLIFAALAPLTAVSAAPARAQGTTGSLIGTVKDTQGGVLAGVTVTISSASLIGGPRVARTGPDGRFAFVKLDPGAYDVRCELASFKAEEIKGVRVALDRAAEVLPKLEVGGLSESLVVVTDAPVVDATRAGLSVVFPLDYLERAALGSQGRTYQSVIGRAAGADNGTGNPHVFGSTDNENAYYIDGIDTTDPVTATFSTNLNFDAIQEISFQTAGYAAEYGRATGGVVNIVTKSGGNQFSGTFDMRYNDTSFDENGRHFNRDLDKTELLKPSATLGGPLLRDRLWFFAAGEYIERKSTPTGSVLTQDRKGGDYLGKLTWQIDPSWHGVAKYYGAPLTVDNLNAGQFVEPATASQQRQPIRSFQAEVNGVLTSRLLFELQGGVNRAEIDLLPQSGNLDLPGIFDQATGVRSNNYFNYQFSHRDRDELQAAITDFLDHFAGSHEVKLGTSYSNLRSLLQNNFSGGAEYLDYNGPINRNASLEIQQQLGPAPFTGKLYSGFLQDAWRALERLTLQLGVRFDEIKFRNEAGVQISDQHYLQPRLGFAYDLTGDAKTVLRGSYGIFMSPNELTLPSFTRVDTAPQFFYAPCSAFYPTAAACAAAAAHFGSTGYLPNDPLHRDPLGYFETSELGSGPEIIEPGLKPMTDTQVTLGIERQLWNRTSLELAYIHKKTNDIFEDTCAENVPTPTPDPTFSHCPIFEVATLPAARRNYQGALLVLNSRARDWLNVKASYVYSRARGSIEDTQNAGADFDFYPNLFVNRYGYLSDDRRHRVRLDGYARLPHGFSIGIQSDYTSPFPYSKFTPTAPYDVIYLAPRGSFRGTSTYNVNLEVRKGFPIGPVRTELIATVLNLLGSEQINGVCQTALGCNGIYPWGGPDSFLPPRRYEAGVRLEF
jgi:hypothetical protein